MSAHQFFDSVCVIFPIFAVFNHSGKFSIAAFLNHGSTCTQWSIFQTWKFHITGIMEISHDIAECSHNLSESAFLHAFDSLLLLCLIVHTMKIGFTGLRLLFCHCIVLHLTMSWLLIVASIIAIQIRLPNVQSVHKNLLFLTAKTLSWLEMNLLMLLKSLLDLVLLTLTLQSTLSPWNSFKD